MLIPGGFHEGYHPFIDNLRSVFFLQIANIEVFPKRSNQIHIVSLNHRTAWTSAFHPVASNPAGPIMWADTFPDMPPCSLATCTRFVCYGRKYIQVHCGGIIFPYRTVSQYGICFKFSSPKASIGGGSVRLSVLPFQFLNISQRAAIGFEVLFIIFEQYL